MPYRALVRYRQAHPIYATAFTQILSGVLEPDRIGHEKYTFKPVNEEAKGLLLAYYYHS